MPNVGSFMTKLIYPLKRYSAFINDDAVMMISDDDDDDDDENEDYGILWPSGEEHCFLITRSSHCCVWCGFKPHTGHM